VKCLSSCVLIAVGIAISAAAQEIGVGVDPAAQPEQGCTFRVDPTQFLKAQARVRQSIHDRVKKLAAARYSEADGLAEGAAIVRRNFIDEEIFGKLEQAKVAPARLSSDEEFIRRIYLDLIGRIPSAAQVIEFVQNTDSDKRDRIIDFLLAAPEFNDKWSVWFEDLVGMTEVLSTSSRRPRIEGRNSFDRWIREQMQNNRPMSEIVKATLTATGNNFYAENGPASFMVLGSAAMGPAQDTYDLQLVKSVSSYLGVGHYDCLLCHSGRGHLDQISLWAARTTRSDAERMAAHFARTRLAPAPNALQFESPLYQSTEVQDVATGSYNLNTNSGNRPSRTPVGTERSLTPEYRDGTRAGDNWRAAFADKLTSDPLFGVNFANRLWREFFGLALIDPVDSIDPDRLDPGNPPPAPWSLQPTHPALLQKLAQQFMNNDTNVRFLIRQIVQSSAYQLSSRYDGEWKVDYVPLFARHYPRRMWAEEVHDAIVRATEVLPRYTWPKVSADTMARGTAVAQSDPVSWAMQLPDVNEPRGTAVVRDFMTSFNRGNRDTARRSSAGSILQELNLMNDNTMVLSKIKMANSPRLKELARIADNGQLVDQLWLTFLSRKPTESERGKAVNYLSKGTTPAVRNTAIEDLSWVAINKIDFLFSY
jgi:hypothetical protein